MTRASLGIGFTLASVLLASGAHADELTLQEKLGRRIYRRGIGSSGEPVAAALGQGAEVAASVLPCAGCHGHDGRGRPEGGLTPSDIVWETLTKPYSSGQASGRKHPPYDERLIKRAITMGVDPAGNPLHSAMPRYRLTLEDAENLAAYLRKLGKIADPGVSEDAIRVGFVLPQRSRGSDLERAVQRILEAFFGNLNAQGGVHGRRIELRFHQPAAAIRSFVESEQIFALAASDLSEGGETAALAEAEEIPVVGGITAQPPADAARSRYVFYLYTGLREQSIALATFAAQKLSGAPRKVAVIAATNGPTAAAAAEVRKIWKDSGWSEVDDTGVADVVFLLDSGDRARSLLKDASPHGKPLFLMPGPLAGADFLDLPASQAGRLFLAYPALPSDVTEEGWQSFMRLAGGPAQSSRHRASQLAALASAEVLVEALKRAGRDLSRERLIDSLEQIDDLRTGVTPPIRYGPNRRIGVTDVHIVAIDPATKKLAALGKWQPAQ